MKSKNLLILLGSIILICLGFVLFFFFGRKTENIVGPIANKILEKPLDKYAFKNLRKTKFEASNIKIGKNIKKGPGFESYVFYFRVNGKKVSGLLNLPARQDQALQAGVPLATETSNAATGSSYPIIIMFRGFVPKETLTRTR
jgi:hypothetical protein